YSHGSGAFVRHKQKYHSKGTFVAPEFCSLILIVDGNNRSRHLLMKQLAALGQKSEGISYGQDALNAVQREDVDLILIDDQVPGMSCLETTRELRRIQSQSPGRHIPIVVVASGTERDTF